MYRQNFSNSTNGCVWDFAYQRNASPLYWKRDQYIITTIACDPMFVQHLSNFLSWDAGNRPVRPTKLTSFDCSTCECERPQPFGGGNIDECTQNLFVFVDRHDGGNVRVLCSSCAKHDIASGKWFVRVRDSRSIARPFSFVLGKTMNEMFGELWVLAPCKGSSNSSVTIGPQYDLLDMEDDVASWVDASKIAVSRDRCETSEVCDIIRGQVDPVCPAFKGIDTEICGASVAEAKAVAVMMRKVYDLERDSADVYRGEFALGFPEAIASDGTTGTPDFFRPVIIRAVGSDIDNKVDAGIGFMRVGEHVCVNELDRLSVSVVLSYTESIAWNASGVVFRHHTKALWFMENSVLFERMGLGFDAREIVQLLNCGVPLAESRVLKCLGNFRKFTSILIPAEHGYNDGLITDNIRDKITFPWGDGARAKSGDGGSDVVMLFSKNNERMFYRIVDSRANLVFEVRPGGSGKIIRAVIEPGYDQVAFLAGYLAFGRGCITLFRPVEI